MNKTITEIINQQKQKIAAAKNAPADYDKNCPFTGVLNVRGKVFEGIVVSKDSHRTARVEWTSRRHIAKYERSMILKTKVAAHNPTVINAHVGDRVLIAECRPLSKTKKFVIIQNFGQSTDYMVKREVIEDDSKISSKDTEKSEEEKQ